MITADTAINVKIIVDAINNNCTDNNTGIVNDSYVWHSDQHE